NGKTVSKASSLLLKNILTCAENAIQKKNVSADLRFGHDTYIIPLLALMDIKDMNVPEANPEKVYMAWSSFKASPMGTNLQLVFYRNGNKDDILVKFLFCEKEVQIPVITDVAPFYHWKDVKAYYEKKVLN
ncbi:MAG: histidine-type phosphatase, partial [Ignavibacteriales bacterium]|nr:histidine-type phosphatase [Ignavibacteriales bacterium]